MYYFFSKLVVYNLLIITEMKNIHFLWIAALLGFTGLSAQEMCGTLDTSAPQNFSSSTGKFVNTGPYCVDVRFHIVRRANGTGGFDQNQLGQVIELLNSSYFEHNITFNNNGHDFINNDVLFFIDDNQFESTEFNNLVVINNDTNAINFYIVSGAATYLGRANGILSNELVMTQNNVLTGVSAHEMGHCLNLYHTHRGRGCGEVGGNTCQEAINGSNSSTCGDLVADTPADPCLRGNINQATCAYIGGGGFNPDTRNIMSYSAVGCLERFTNGQGQRMRDALENSTILQAVTGNVCVLPEITGSNCACSSPNTTYNIQNTGGAIVVWEVTSRLEIVSSNNTSITVRGVSGTRGAATISATVNGIVETKDIWVGAPNPPSTLLGPSTVLTGALVNYSSSVAPGATSYEWRLPYPFDVVNQFDYFGQKWQMRPTTGRYLNAFTGYAGTSGLVQVWGKNKCGNGGAKTMSVSHGSGGGGGIPLHAKFFGDDIGSLTTMAYPNPVDHDLYLHIKDRDLAPFIAVSLNSMDGKLLFFSSEKSISSIDVSSLPDGQYILSIDTGIERKTSNIIVKH